MPCLYERPFQPYPRSYADERDTYTDIPMRMRNIWGNNPECHCGKCGCCITADFHKLYPDALCAIPEEALRRYGKTTLNTEH